MSAPKWRCIQYRPCRQISARHSLKDRHRSSAMRGENNTGVAPHQHVTVRSETARRNEGILLYMHVRGRNVPVWVAMKGSALRRRMSCFQGS
ncbi:hypothetical protein PsYK624_012520 [Phanerochaete sordida]|uniref:Uncharacterized protein n=1 Tax=Phanerochaete sordida TaxID=48140 RepID=A0A9P3FZW1_9APHY|nr:hypothetical protein PsYK624_012520 [Phanerochaete sordida]